MKRKEIEYLWIVIIIGHIVNKVFVLVIILICSSPRRFDTINGIDVNIPLDKYIKAEKQIIENYGLPFLDFFHEYAHYMFSGDKIHASGESYDLFGRVIARKLESM